MKATLLEPQVTVKGLNKTIKDYEKRLDKVRRRTLATIAKQAKTFWARRISQETKIPVTQIKNSIHLSVLAKDGVLTFNASHWKGRTPIFKYPGATQNKRGVRVRGGRLILHAFIATMPKTGHKGVFLRDGKERLPIHELFFYYEHVITAAEKVLPEVVSKIRDDWEKIFLRQINYEFNVNK